MPEKLYTINLYKEERKIGEAGFLQLGKLPKQAGKNKLILFNPEIAEPVNQGEEIELRIIYLPSGIEQLINLQIDGVENLAGRDAIKLTGDYFPAFIHTFNQYHLDIYKAWQEGSSVDLTTKSSAFKHAWARACFFYCGLQNTITGKSPHIIEGCLVKDDIDLYILLGQAFFGTHGYMGACGDSFHDCLCEPKLLPKNHNRKIIIKDYDLACNALAKNSRCLPDAMVFFEAELTGCGFRIEHA